MKVTLHNTIWAAVMDADGKLMMECPLDNKADTIVEFIQGLEGTLSLISRKKLGFLSIVLRVIDSFTAWLRQRSLHFFQHPVIGRFQMAVVAVEPAMENMRKEAGALPGHYRIALHRLKVTIGTVAEENLHLPLALGVIRVAVGIDFGRQIVNSGTFPCGVLRLFHINERWSRYRGI